MPGHHPIQADHITLQHAPKPTLPHLRRIHLILPTRMIRSDINPTMSLVPRAERRVGLRFDGPQGARDKVQDGADLELALARREELFHAQVGVADAHEDEVGRLVAFEVVVPEVADEVF